MSRYVEHAGNPLGATIVAAMWRDAIANGHVISTDATGAMIRPTKPKMDGRSGARRVTFHRSRRRRRGAVPVRREAHQRSRAASCSARSAACSKPTPARSTIFSSEGRRRMSTTPTPRASRSSGVGHIAGDPSSRRRSAGTRSECSVAHAHPCDLRRRSRRPTRARR
jgi:hypothetical protein